MTQPIKSHKYIFFEKWVDPLSEIGSEDVTWPDIEEEDEEYDDGYTRKIDEDHLPMAKKHTALVSTPLGTSRRRWPKSARRPNRAGERP